MKKPFDNAVKEDPNAVKEDPLLQAGSSGDLEKVEQLLQSLAPYIQETEHADDNAALCLAASNKDYYCANPILRPSEPRVVECRSSASHGHADIVLQLLDIFKNAHANKNEAFRNVADAVCADYYADYYVDYYADYKDKEDPLLYAVASGDREKVEQLLRSSTIQETAHANENAALRLAAGKDYTAIVIRLLEIPKVRATAHALENEALRKAVYYDNAVITQKLLAIDAVYNNAHANENEALRWAAKNGNAALVRLLLAAPKVFKNAHARDNSALTIAAIKGYSDIVEQLLVNDDVVKTTENDALWQAACSGHTVIVKKLLTIPEVLKHAHDKDNSVLRIAVDHNHEEIIALLLAVPHIRNSVPSDLLTRPVIQKILQEQKNTGLRLFKK